jgi:uroporphyrinogen decarboxylase
MNGRERMLTAMDLGEPDRVPIWELIINDPVIHAIAGHMSREEFAAREGLDGMTIFEDTKIVEWIDRTTYRDEWGIRWRIEPSGLSYPGGGPIASEDDLDDYSPPDPDDDHRLVTLEKAVKEHGESMAIVFISHEAFEFSHYLHGMKNLLIAYYRNPHLVTRLADIVMNYKIRLIERACDLGADIIVTGDDYCNRTGPIMSLEHFERFVLPYLKMTVDTSHRKGVPHIKHTDGNIWPIFDQMIGAGIDAIDPLEPIAGMDIGEVKERYGDRLCLMGNIDCGDLLSRGTPEEVTVAVRNTIARAAKGGGYVLASSNSIHPAVKPENYVTMVMAGRQYGSYPI